MDARRLPYPDAEKLWNQYHLAKAPDRLSTSGLAGLASDIVRDIEEIEACAGLGVGEMVSDFSHYSGWLAKFGLSGHLAEAIHTPGIIECPKRAEWIDFALQRFKHSLADPKVVFEIHKCYHQTDYRVIHSGYSFSVRVDQITSQRFWGIGYCSKSKDIDDLLAKACFRPALKRLSSDIGCINEFCAGWATHSESLKGLSFTFDRKGNYFEQMILGVLNLQTKLVALPSLKQDVREWADLIVVKNGNIHSLKIQIKFFRKTSDHDSVAANHIKSDRNVLISPVSIARFLDQYFDPEIFNCSWGEFLSVFPQPPASVESLASQIYWLFENLFKSPINHPFSPLLEIPFPIRLAIQSMVNLHGEEICARRKAIKLLKDTTGKESNVQPCQDET